MGDLDTHDFTCRSICLESQMIVVAVDYSLSPEHKFPYAVEEVKDVLNSLVNFENEFFIDLENIFVCGDSAGGNLATVLAINSRDKKGNSDKRSDIGISLCRSNFNNEIYGYFS